MIELMRDTSFGQVVRLITKGKFFAYPEEKDPSLWKKFVNEEKSGFAAHHGVKDGALQPHGEESDEEEYQGIGGVRTRENGRTEPTEPVGRRASGNDAVVNSETSSMTRIDEGQREQGADYNHASGVKVDPEKGRDLHIVDWYGPDDEENPQNWSTGKKFFVTFELCLLTFSVYIGSAIYSAGIEDVEQVFGVSQAAATLGLTMFVLGYGTGPLIFAPMSEIPQIGRNPIYIGTLIVFVALQFPVIYAKNFGMLLAFRFLTGFFGSPVLATGGASISDMYSPRKKAYAISVWGIAAISGPVMGPLVGSFAAMFKGWTWTIWELTWLSGAALIFLIFFLPETSANNILYRRTVRLRKATGDDKLRCEPELEGEAMKPMDIVRISLIRPITLNFTEPIVFLLNLYIALIYALLYCWFESFPIVFVQIYGWPLDTSGLAYLGILIGSVVTLAGFFAYLYYIQEPQFDENGNIQPEKRLPPACVGGFFIPICLFMFGWTSRSDVHWIVPIIGSSFFAVGSFLLFQAVLNYLGDAYPTKAASVLAGNDFMRSCFGAGFPVFAGAMFRKLGINWGSSLLGFLSILFIPIPFVLYYKGEVIRKKYSKNARHDI